MQTCNPLHARQWFKAKPWVNILATGIAFAILLFILTYFLDFWLAITVSSVVSCSFFFFYLELQTITIICKGCRRPVETNIPWYCGYCHCKNENVRSFPFINECKKCQQVPKAYKCHHCEELIFLTHDPQTEYFARRLTAEELVPPIPEDKIGKKVAVQAEDVRDLQHEFKVTRLKTHIEMEKRRKIEPEEISLYDELFKHYEAVYEKGMARDAAIEAVREIIRKKFPNQPEIAERHIAKFDQVVADEIL